MIPIEFEGQNIVFGEGQEEYQNLPAYLDLEKGSIDSCWELSPEEFEVVMRTRRIWIKQLTFNKPMQPILLSVNKI